MTEQTADAATVTTRYGYTNFGNLKFVIENATSTQPLCVTVTGMVDSNVCTQYAYDHIGNLIRITLGNGTVRQYQYDALGRMIFEVTDPTGLALFIAEKP